MYVWPFHSRIHTAFQKEMVSSLNIGNPKSRQARQVQQRFEWPNYSSHSRKAPPLSEVMAAVVQVSTHLYGNRGNLCGFKVMPITHPTGRLISLKEAVPGKICKMPSITLHPGRREGYCKMLRCCPKMVDIARLKSWYEKQIFPQSFANRFGLS